MLIISCLITFILHIAIYQPNKKIESAEKCLNFIQFPEYQNLFFEYLPKNRGMIF